MAKALSFVIFTIVSVASAKQSATAIAHSLSVPDLPAFLQKSDPCSCAHKGSCSCDAALKFMTCISDRCGSDQCKCMHEGQNHFREACENMAAGCADIGLECADDSAMCEGNSIAYAQGYAQDVQQDYQQQEEAESATEQQQQTDESSEGLGEQLGVNSGGSRDKIKIGGQRYVSHDQHKHKVKKLHNHEHHIFAKGIIVTIVVMSIAVALGSSSNFTIVKNTWNTMDYVVVTFLALAWFYVTMHCLEFHGLHGWWKVFMHAAIAILLLLVSSVVSFVMKRNSGGDERSMEIFNSIFNNIILWCFAGFVSNVQQQFKHSTVFVLVATLGLMVFYAGLAFFWYYVIGRFVKDKEISSATINKLTGAALAAGIVLWVHMLMAGEYHTVEHPRPAKPSFYETLFMNTFSFVWVFVALKGVPLAESLSEGCKANSYGQYDTKTYWKKRGFDSLVVFVGFLPYYSCVLSLGHLIVDNLGYDESEIEARLWLSVVSTLIGVGLIFMCAKVPQLQANELLSGVLIGLGGFMTGSAWANLLNNSINMMTHGYSHPFKMKFYITCFLTAVVFPVYFYAFKPMVEKMTTPPKSLVMH